MALINQAVLDFQSCRKIASCRKRAREPPPSTGACKQLWNSSYAAVLGREPRMKHTFKGEKKPPCGGDDVHMAPTPAAPQPNPAQPSPGSSCSRNCGNGFHSVSVLRISWKPCHSLKDILFWGGDSPFSKTVTGKLFNLWSFP